MSSQPQQSADMTGLERAQKVLDAYVERHGCDDAITFEDDTVILTTTDAFISEHTTVIADYLSSLDAVTITETDNETVYEITFKLWLAFRRANADEFEACKHGVQDGLQETYDDAATEVLPTLETEFYEVGYELGTDADSGTDPETVFGGRIPKVILYHRDHGYSGPSYHGTAIDYHQLADFTATDMEDIINDSQGWRMETHESPDVTVMHSLRSFTAQKI